MSQRTSWERLEREWPELSRILGGYLHQDWDIEGDTPDDALRLARREGDSTDLATAVQEIDALLATQLDETGLREIVERMTEGYSPSLDGWEIRPWLRHVRQILAGGA